MTESERDEPEGLSRDAAVAAVVATYFYFLIFAEFALLELVQGVAGEAWRLRVAMAMLGAGGLAGGVGAALLTKRWRASAMLAWTMRACAASAALAAVAGNFATMLAASGVTGLVLGAQTVTLAASLRAAIGVRRLGLGIGVGTGAAYALCNLPWVFRAPPAVQAWLAAAGMALVSFAVVAMRETRSGADRMVGERKADVGRWLVVFVALVWLDSAAFYIIQHTPALRARTWSDDGVLLSNAGVHLFAAIAAGVLLDRGGRKAAVAAAVLALALAASVLNGVAPDWISPSWCYTAGVSLYSVALVEYPARSGGRWLAAVVFGVAGWIGSALGIGMAQDLATIPPGFVALAVALAAIGILGKRRGVRLATLVVAIVTVSVRGDEVLRGREVYIAEGCIHCHSQYLRPRVPAEVLNWGPAKSLDETRAEAPPLIGTRRQGPDLSRVGNRRSDEWNRLHLIAPRAVSPGSRMPSYAHLFKKGDDRGEALVAYLASLGAQTREERAAQVASWTPDASRAIAPEAAARLFGRLCAQCHGANGDGAGAFAARLHGRPPDWTRDPWRHVRATENEEEGVSRIIKFGLPGLPMAGHEYLPDEEIVGLARHVLGLHKGSGGDATPALQP